MKRLFALVILIGAMALSSVAHIPVATLVKIVKAEDERRFDATLETLMKNAKPRTRERAALAAGRIGNDAALPALTTLVERDIDINVRSMAMFAIGEIESIKSADFVTGILSNTKEQGDVRARAVEAAGKIAAANAKDPKSKELGTAIVEALRFEAGRRSMPDRDTIILGLTAALRVRPDGAAEVIAKFLGYSDERVRADAGNALARIRTRIATDELRKMLMSDSYSIARANAARALGAAEDKDSVGMLLDAALADPDPRVRVSAIGAVAALKDTSVVPKLVVRGNALMAEYRKSKFKNPSEKNELLSIASTLGRLMAGTSDNDAIEFIEALRTADKFTSPESEIAYARIDPGKYVGWVVDSPQEAFGPDWRSSSAVFQALGTIASLETNEKNSHVRTRAKLLLVSLIQGWIGGDERVKAKDSAVFAIPDLLQAFAAFKSETTSDILRPLLESETDPLIRAAVADILGDQKANPDNFEALKKAFTRSLLTDKIYDDATLSIMNALFKLDKNEASGMLLIALSSSDYLVRKRALQLLGDPELQKDKPGIPTMIENAIAKKKDQVSSFSVSGKLGIINSTQADYVRAVTRKNGSVKAVLTTEKGVFTIEFAPEEAPLTVDNFIKLARAGYFNGLTVHRVVPNFVMQDGDSRGDGNGGPGRSIRCEINTLPYERGAVGMALSGKDTGGSQWFVTHSPQPHLDGGYTVFGRVDQEGMKVVDSIVRGDKIIKITIVGK